MREELIMREKVKTAKELDRIFDEGKENILGYFDTENVIKVKDIKDFPSDLTRLYENLPANFTSKKQRGNQNNRLESQLNEEFSVEDKYKDNKYKAKARLQLLLPFFQRDSI